MSDTLVITEADGDFTLDADLVAKGFGWSSPELRDHMRRGLVTSRVERGEGEDAGTWRLTVQCGNRQWQAIIGRDGSIVGQHVGFTRHRAGAENATKQACPAL